MAPRRRERRDFREFVFTATGAETDLRRVERLDLIDNLAAEVERLEAIEELLEGPAEPVGRSGLGLLIGDVRRRLREMVRIAGEAQADPPR